MLWEDSNYRGLLGFWEDSNGSIKYN
ncbi:unnamed protein product [Cuscuta epithymum]|uniref:Uncharacterized protein n=1 Tax=Cuscuta epithymum TaxID=186058 RepID=A0AAV0EMR2_9ASTE|nr:unnamed protein product [Cuscuta epithymum]